jgi:GNAT superfamily N-acetyltransferase
MSFHLETPPEYHMGYSVYFQRVIFVHNFFVTPSKRGQGCSRVAFKRLKMKGLPIALEAAPALVGFYEKLGFHKSCTGREGYAEMNWRPTEEVKP